MNKLASALLAISAMGLQAQNIEIYAECAQATCQEWPNGKESLRLETKPAFAIGPANVLSAEIYPKDANQAFSQEQLALQLDEAGAKELAELTARLIGKKIALVYEGKILTAPVVNTPITQGSVIFTAGENKTNFQEMIPWLKDKIRVDEIVEKSGWSQTPLTYYLAMALVLAGLLYVFQRRGPKSSS